MIETTFIKFINDKITMERKVRLLFFIALVSLFLVPLVNAASSDCASYGTFRQNSPINITQTCGDCTFINISGIVAPDSSQVLGQVPMVLTNGQYLYTFTNTGQLGRYTVTGNGDDSQAKTWCYSFDVTSGLTGNIGFYFIVVAIIALILILGFYTEELWIIILGGLFMIVLGLYFFINGIMGITDPMLNVFISIMIMVLGFYISVKSSLDIINDNDGGSEE